MRKRFGVPHVVAREWARWSLWLHWLASSSPRAATPPPPPFLLTVLWPSAPPAEVPGYSLTSQELLIMSSVLLHPALGQVKVRLNTRNLRKVFFIIIQTSDDSGFKTHRLLLYKQLAILYFLSKSIVFLPCIRSHISASLSVFLCSSSFLSFSSSWDPEIQICFLNIDVDVSFPPASSAVSDFSYSPYLSILITMKS